MRYVDLKFFLFIRYVDDPTIIPPTVKNWDSPRTTFKLQINKYIMETIDAKLVWKGMKKDNTFALAFEYLSNDTLFGSKVYKTKFLSFEKETDEMKEMLVFNIYQLPKSLLK